MSDTVFPYDDEVVDPYDDDEVKNPHEETVADDQAGDDESPPKRGPGRPRKTAG